MLIRSKINETVDSFHLLDSKNKLTAVSAVGAMALLATALFLSGKENYRGYAELDCVGVEDHYIGNKSVDDVIALQSEAFDANPASYKAIFLYDNSKIIDYKNGLDWTKGAETYKTPKRCS